MIRAFILFGAIAGATFGVVSWGCYATTDTTGSNPSDYPMPDDGHQPIDINAMRRDR